MDANETRFQLLLGRSDWESCTLPGAGPIFGSPESPLEWNAAQHEVQLRSLPFRFQAPPDDLPPDPGEATGPRRGVAADLAGNIYTISQDRREILRQAAGQSHPAHFWSAADSALPAHTDTVFQPEAPLAPPSAKSFGGLAVTADHFLAVGTLEPAGILLFDLVGAGAPRFLRWPVEVPLAPFALAARREGGFWILDRKRREIWTLNRALRVIPPRKITDVTLPPDLFRPGGERTIHVEEIAASRITPAFAWPTGALDPTAIAGLPDDSLLVLDAPLGGPARILRLQFGAIAEEVARLTFAAYDFLFLAQAGVVRLPESEVKVAPAPASSCREGGLLVASAEGNQAFGFELWSADGKVTIDPTPDYIPMRRFGGRGLVAANGKAYYDFGERWLPLVAQPHARHVASGTLETRRLDGHEPHCVWHRLIVQACLPPGAAIEVWSRAADEPRDLALTAWQLEPNPLRRATGSEQPFAPTDSTGYFELLAQNARGRYAQLRVRLSGDGRVTPRLHALRWYYPRFSYVDRYLPKVYREDPSSASFLQRFLANFEGTNTAIEGRIAAAQVLFDARTAPAETLSWLASWFGLALDPAWDENRRRLFLGSAMNFFQWRGTVRGLKMALRLALEDTPDAYIFDDLGSSCVCADRFRVVEHFLARRTPRIDPEPAPLDSLFAPAAGEWRSAHGLDALRARFDAAVANEGKTSGGEAAELWSAFARRALGFARSETTAETEAWRDYQVSRGQPSEPIPLDQPANPVLARLWREFQEASDGLPFGEKRRAWQRFLIRRYVGLAALNQAHRTRWDSFETVAYPAEIPATTKVLQDWIDFEARVLPAIEVAHRFTVLLPLTRAAASDYDERVRVLKLAGQLIELEKPAHTAFDLKFFTAHFRLGETRLGEDSVLSRGGRDPAVLAPTILGQSPLGETFMTPGTPPLTPGRLVPGRARLPFNPPNSP